MAAANSSTIPEQVSQAISFYDEREGADQHNRTDFSDDLKFAYQPGAQWDALALSKRQGRPNYSYNRVVGAINGIVGEQRMVRPSGRVRPTSVEGSVEMAEIFSGLIRDIEHCSGAPAIYAEQFKYAVAGGWGVWRFVPQYVSDKSFDQVLRLHRVRNPLTVMFDNLADMFGRGSMKCLISERVSRSTYKDLFGDEAYANFPMSRDSEGWYDANEIRIAEFYRKILRHRKLLRLTDGRVFWADEFEQESADMKAAGIKVADVHTDRMVEQWQVEWTKIDGRQILEGPHVYEYRHIPVVRCPGRHVNIEGREEFQSLHRHAKDAQKTYNYNRSSMTETVALTPRAPWLVTAAMIKGYENDWNRANVSNAAYLLYNIDENNPQAVPVRNAAPEVPQAYIALSLHDAEDIKHTTGYSNPAVEAQTRAGDAESGKALRTRLMMGDSGSYEFLDNFAMAVQYGWEIMIDMSPGVYSMNQMVRLLGSDGAETFRKLDPKKLKEGSYDVAVTLGPAHATARMEALDTLLEAAERMPIVYEEAPDLILKNLDAMGADEIVDRVRRRLIAEGKVQPTERELEQGIQPPPPDPAKAALTRRLLAQAGLDEAKMAKVAAEAREQMAKAQGAEKIILGQILNLFADVKVKEADAAEATASAISKATTAPP